MSPRADVLGIATEFQTQRPVLNHSEHGNHTCLSRTTRGLCGQGRHRGTLFLPSRVTEERKPSLEETPTGHLPFQGMMKASISFQTSHICPRGQRPSQAFSSSSIQDSQSSPSTFGYDHSLSRCESCCCQRWSLLCQTHTHVELGSCGRHTLVHLR